MEILRSSSDAGSGVLEDEFGVAFRRERANQVELSLGELDERFLVARSKDEFANCSREKVVSIQLLKGFEVSQTGAAVRNGKDVGRETVTTNDA